MKPNVQRWVLAVAAGLLGGCGTDGIPTRTIANQPSWIVRSEQVELAVTKLGGHMAPVRFYCQDARAVQPYYISPWQDEGRRLDVGVLVPLRGDFFCMPFGANAQALGSEKHPPHGEVACSPWQAVGLTRQGGVTTLELALQPRIRPGKVTKRLSLVDGHNVVYCQHVLEGFRGRLPVAHHATLAVPEQEGSLRVATSPIRFGRTAPVLFSDPRNREYQSFAVDQQFADLRHVPLMWREPAEADATAFPARTGFTDLLQIYSVPADQLGGKPAWTAVTNQQGGYLWFSLKDPRVLPATVFWISNRGRQGPPWDGRNRCLGIEDSCSYFAEGLAESAQPNKLNAVGIPTALELSPERATRVNYIQGVVKVPEDFRMVQSVEFGPDSVTFTSITGKKVSATVRYDFVFTGNL